MLTVYVHDTDRLVTRDNAAAGDDDLPAVWFDLLAPTPDEDRMVERALGVSVPSRDEMEEIELSARLYSENGAEYMTVITLNALDADEPFKTPTTFVLKDTALVTVRYVENRPFSSFVARACKAGGSASNNAELVMLGLLEALIDRLAEVLERLSGEVDALSREVFRRRASAKVQARDLEAVIEQIGRKGEIVSMTRESLVSITRLLTYHRALDATNSERAPRDTRQKIVTLQRDVGSLSDHATFLSNKINFLLDATLGLINLEQNQIIKIFSVAAVVFLPPTLVASIYGMNFVHMPELAWMGGYPFALALMLLSALLPYWLFKKRGWL